MNIRDLRKAAGLTQRELAERVNVTQGAVSNWERGKIRPLEKWYPAIAEALGISVKELV